MRLLVGLGNPGEKYAKTRHNLGFYCIDKLACSLEEEPVWKPFKDGVLAKLTLGKEKVLLFKPQQFMNTSGVAVRQVVDYYSIEPADICIVADDVYIASGSARIRHGGGDGGHNGWRSVLEKLETDSFWRVRIGAGLYEQHPDKRQTLPPLDEYVLLPQSKEDSNKTHNLIDRLVPILLNWLERGELKAETLH